MDEEGRVMTIEEALLELSIFADYEQPLLSEFRPDFVIPEFR